jgi:tRNA dimethylallyltransferase
LIIGLTAERKDLYRRVDARVDAMLQNGLVEEVENLRKMEYPFDLPALSSLGYRQIAYYLDGQMELAEAVKQMKTETHRFIRHQYNWFRLTDERIKWFDIETDFFEGVGRLLSDFLLGGP